MKVKVLALADYMRDAAKLNKWMADISQESHGEFTPDLLQQIISRGTHLGLGWLTDDDELVGLVVTTVVQYGHYKCLSIVGAAGVAGGSEGYQMAHNVFNAIAANSGCERFEFRGRRGFAKKFKPLGWREKYTVYECETKNDVAPGDANDGDVDVEGQDISATVNDSIFGNPPS